MGRVTCLTLVALLVLVGCGSDSSPKPASTGAGGLADSGPVHVHGLGINPADGALFIATHTGLFRAGPSERFATRVGDSRQDTMGFTVVGADRFLGSGHPDNVKQPPFLGLIASSNAGRSWQPVSLYGKTDFHVLESKGQRVVGYGSNWDTRRAQLMVSDNGGRSWSELRSPMPLVDLAVSPNDPDVWVASGERALVRTTDAGRSWKTLRGTAGLLAWGEPARFYRVDGAGAVSVSGDRGTTWKSVGDVGGQPAAVEAGPNALYAALHDGLIHMSRDGGRSWSLRSRPAS